MNVEGVDSLHRCGMCGSCGKQPWWAPEVLKTLPPRERIRLKRKLEDGRRAFVAIREEAAAKKAASEAASNALKQLAASKNPSISETSMPDVSTPFALTNSIATNSPTANGNDVHVATDDSPKSSGTSSSGLQNGLEPGASVLHSMKTKQETGFGDNKEGSLNEIQGELKKMRESALASYDSDIDSDTAPSGLMCRTPDNSSITPAVSSPSDEAYYTPRATNDGLSSATNTNRPEKTSTERISLGSAAVSSNGIPAASPEVTAHVTSVETPVLGGATVSFDMKKHRRGLSSATLGTVSLASSPGAVGETKPSPEASVALPDVTEKENKKEPPKECGDCSKANSRVRELELHVEALQCALKARELVSAGKKGKKAAGAKGENQRLRDEVDSLRLTVDFLFRKLQKYETSPRDRPEVH